MATYSTCNGALHLDDTAYNGHFECTCYILLFLFNQFGDLEWATLRRGNNASAKFWQRMLLPAIERYRHLHAENALEDPVLGSQRGLLGLEDGKECQKVCTR